MMMPFRFAARILSLPRRVASLQFRPSLQYFAELSAHAWSIDEFDLISDDSALSREVADSVTFRIANVHTASNSLHNSTFVSIRFGTTAL